jgi:hypothetical protein
MPNANYRENCCVLGLFLCLIATGPELAVRCRCQVCNDEDAARHIML